MLQTRPFVSVCCLTYNHEKYLSRALDSILIQKTTFPIEIIVHDDASADGTRNIINEFAKKYPEIIRPVFQESNQLKSDIGLYQIYTKYVFPLAKGKYIAICEGDDFWSDQAKLQIQIDFMEKQPECTVCFHKAGILKNGETNFDIYKDYHKRILNGRSEFTFNDLLQDNVIPNCSVVYRNTRTEFPDLFGNIIFPDWPLHLIYAKNGKLGYINKFMAVHHDHESGLWNGNSMINKTKSIISFYIDLLSYLEAQYHPTIYTMLDRYSHGFEPVDFGSDFEIGYSYGLVRNQREINKLQEELNSVFQSGSWKMAKKITNFISYFSHKFGILKGNFQTAFSCFWIRITSFRL